MDRRDSFAWKYKWSSETFFQSSCEVKAMLFVCLREDLTLVEVSGVKTRGEGMWQK